MPTPLTYAYRGIAGRAADKRPAAAIVDPATGKVYDGAGFVAEATPTRAKRLPMTPCLGDPALYLLSVSGDWPATARVLVYDLADDTPPSDNGPPTYLVPVVPAPAPAPTAFSATFRMVPDPTPTA